MLEKIIGTGKFQIKMRTHEQDITEKSDKGWCLTMELESLEERVGENDKDTL